MENVNIIIANNIQSFRKKAGLTQEELANKLGVTFQAVSKWENEKSTPDISLLPLLSDTFGCSIDELFSRKTYVDENKSENNPRHSFDGEMDWADDGIIRGVIFEGRKMIKNQKALEKFTFEIVGEAKRVNCGCNLSVRGSVSGGCNAGREITIGGSLSGGCNAGRSLTVGGNLSGGCNVGKELTVGNSITGNINAREITAKTIKAEKLIGNASCENLECDIIKGTVTIINKPAKDKSFDL